jgi:hypothetical protein
MLGIITAIGALFLELSFFTFFNLEIGSSYLYASSLSLALIFSIFLEESLKIIVLYQLLKKLIQEKASRGNIFLSALMVGLGFSAMEILLNLFNSQINRYLSFLDVFGILAVHTGTFSLLGYFLARWNNLPFKKFTLFFPVIFIFHLYYNSLILYAWPSGFYFLFIAFTLLLILFFFRDIKKLSKKNLPKSEFSL